MAKFGRVRSRSIEWGFGVTVLPWMQHGYRTGWIVRVIVGHMVFYAATERGAERAWRQLLAAGSSGSPTGAPQ